MQTAGLKGARLSLLQARLWRWQQESQAYRVQCALNITGALEPEHFQQALQQVLDRHAILSTIFARVSGMELPMQVIGSPIGVSCSLVPLETLAASAREQAIDEQFQLVRERPFDLEKGPLLHATLLRFSAQEHVLILSIHALCADAASLKQLATELLHAYAGSLSGSIVFEEEPLQYVNVSAWLNELLQEEDAVEQQQFWDESDLSQLATHYLPFERSEDRSRRTHQPQLLFQNFVPQQITQTLAPAFQQRLQELCERLEVSPEAILLACWNMLLWRLTGDLAEDATTLIGLTGDGRPYEELASVVGLYTRTVPFHFLFSDDLSFEWVVRQTEQGLQEAIEKQFYFTWKTASTEEQFFPVSMHYTSWPERIEEGPLALSLLRQECYTEPFVLRFQPVQRGKQLEMGLAYLPTFLSQAQAERLLQMLSWMLEQVLHDPQMALGAMTLLAQEQQEELRQAFVAPRRDWPAGWLHELFMQQARCHPQQLAVVCGEEHLSYEQLDVRSTRLAHRLRRLGVGPNQLVVLALPRSVDWLVAMLGVLKAGGAYVPLDLEHPAARLLAVIQECQPVALLVSASTWQEWQREQVQDQHIPGVVFLWDTLMGELEQGASTPLENEVRGDDLAAVIYTSGSTGQPKGVMIRHEGMRNYTQSILELLQSEAGWHFATVSTLAADLGNTALFGALASGGCVHLLPYDLVTTGAAFARYQQQWPLDVLKIVPSHLQALLNALAEEGGALLPRRALVLGGEALPWSLVARIKELGARCQVYNHYGPTETTVGALVAPLGRPETWELPQEPQRTGSVPIGRALPNMRAFILDRGRQVLPPEVVGELYLGGAGLGAGYLYREEQSAERFVAAPWEPRERLYRTGDLVRGRADGQIEFVGRVDGQVKLRGYRVELGEIEEVLRRHEEVREAVVVLRQDAGDVARLVAYIVPWKVPGPGAEQLRQWVGQQLPEYMVPAVIVKLEQLPLTRNGKLDRKQLPAPGASEHEERAVGEGARTLVEELLVGVWEQVLGVKPIGRAENFFRLGGHSLLGTQLIARLRPLFGVEVPITWLFAAPTVAQLAERIEQALAGGQGAGEAEMPLVAVKRSGEGLPLSYAQQRLWFLEQLEPGTATYNIPSVIHLHGALDLRAFEQALAAIVERHEILRTTFVMQDNQPVQIVASEARYGWAVADLQAWPEASREQEALRLVLQEAERPFDLVRGPLLRSKVLRLAEQDQIVVLTVHHIVSDGWSSSILVREVAAAYAAFHNHVPLALSELSIQYADYALWQRAWLQGAVQETQLAYWQRQLAGVPALELPSDHPRPAIQSYRGAQCIALVPQSLNERLKDVAQQEGVTLFMLLLASFQVLLNRYSGQTDIAVGTPIANRRRQEVEGLIGLFINMLVLRSDLSGDPSFRALLAQVRQRALEAYQHQDIPFEQVVEALQPERDRSRSPLFQVMFALQNTPRAQETLSDLTLEVLESEQTTAKFDLSLIVIETEQGLRCTAEYSTDLFEAETIDRLLQHWQTLLEGVLADPEQRIATLSLLSQAEREQILVAWNETQRPYPAHACLHQLIEAQVERTPNHIALIYEEQTRSYRELNREANQLAHQLQAAGVGPEVLVGVCMERSLEMVVALLAILKAGGAYVPLDPTYPQERLAYMIEDAQVSVLLTQSHLQERLPRVNAHLICLDPGWNADVRGDEQNPVSAVSPDNLIYMIYTSGSTGRPKGVLNIHRAVVNRLHWMQQEYQLSSEDRVLQKTPFSFDVSVWEFFWPLLTGAGLVIARPGGQQDPTYLASLIASRHVTTLHFVPSMLQAFLQEPYLTSCTSLKRVICSGEALPAELQQRFFARFPTWVQLHNLYGPTEAAIDVTYWQCRRDDPSSIVPIGHPIANTQIYILDAAMQPVPIGVAGELHIGGIGLARGYHNRPELTAEKFVCDPFDSRADARLFKTADLARYRPDGAIEFLGRIDHQVKLRGFRIELGEIEAILDQHPQISQSVVALRGESAAEKQLVAYLVARDTVPPASNELRQYLHDRLPQYMIPSLFIALDALPLTPNGKVDRRALASVHTQPEEAREVVLPRTSLEEQLALIWSELLKYAPVGVHDNFFDVGGHSLLATRLASRVRSVFQIEFPLSALFDAPTIAGLAQIIEQTSGDQRQKQQGPVPVRTSREQAFPLTFAQQRLWFLDQLEPGSAVYNMPIRVLLRGPLDIMALQRSLDALVARHESLRTVFQLVQDQPAQFIRPAEAVALPLIELHHLAPEERKRKVQSLVREKALKPFDPGTGPLLRTTLIRLGAEEHIFLLTIHHIVSDGWSLSVLMNDVSVLYNAFLNHEDPRLPALPIQYADYALWQRQWLRDEVLERQLRYWTGHLAGLTPLELPTDRPRPSIQTYNGALQELLLPVSLSTALQMLARREGVTLFMTLLAAFQVLLMRYSGQDDIAIGTLIANRTHEEVEHLIGLFINTLVLRTDLSGNPSFQQLLARVRDVTLGAYAHQDMPFEKLVETLQPERDLSRSPLFQVMFVLQNTDVPSGSFMHLDLQPLHEENQTAVDDLFLSVRESDEGLLCVARYNTDLFDQATIAQMLANWQTLLAAIVEQPERSIAHLPLLSDEERQQILYEWNATERAYPFDRHYAQLFMQQVERAPWAIAAVAGQERLTYAQLYQQVLVLAVHLERLGVGPEVLVGLYLPRSLDLLVAVLATFLAGGAYVPLDPQYPQQRLTTILRDARVRVILTRPALRASLPAHFDTAVLMLSDILDEREPFAETQLVQKTASYHGGQLAYMIYTSGSTGIPKGAMVTQRGMLNHLYAKIETLQMQEGDRLAFTASPSFDISVWQMLSPLLCGGQVQILDEEMVRDPRELIFHVQRERIQIVEVVPTLLQALLDVMEQEQRSWSLALRWLVVTGEALPAQVARRWLGVQDQVPLVNAYGPTECSDDVTQAVLRTIEDLPNERVPIGRALSNTQLYVLDAALQPVPVGVLGEIYVGGVGVGRGYWRQESKTAEVFLPDPFVIPEPGQSLRFYKTGDVGRYRRDGQLEFMGRIDEQVKIRGYRIELGEIETVLSRHPGVQRCAVIVHEGGREQRLVAYIVPQPGMILAMAEIRAYLKEQLPEYMVPSALLVLKQLPMTPNGKLDRKALPAPDDDMEEDSWDMAPRGEVEGLIHEIWVQVLGRERIGVQENFFEAGGHSLLATQVRSRIRVNGGVDLPLRVFFESATIEAQARLVEQQLRQGAGQEQIPPLVPTAHGTEAPLSYAQQRLWFLHQLNPDSVAYNTPVVMKLQGRLDRHAFERSLEAVVQRHETLRTVFVERDGQPVQVIEPVGKMKLHAIDLRETPRIEREAVAWDIARREATQPFDLTAGPLLRVTLVQVDDEAYLLLLTMHHIVSDGWSMSVLIRELTAVYLAFLRGEAAPLAALPIQYADYALWQRSWLQGEMLREQIRYWTRQLSGAQALELPTDRPRPTVQSYRGARYSFQLPLSLLQSLQRLDRQEGVTLFMTLLSAFQVLLYRWSGRQDIVLGTDSANRSRIELEGLIGFFVNLLVMRTSLAGNPPFREVLQRVREMVLGAYTHQDLPFEMIVEHLRLERQGSRTPLVNVLFVMQNVPMEAEPLPGLEVQPLESQAASAKFDMAVFVMEGPEGLYGSVDYNTDLFEEQTIATLMQRFAVLLKSALEQLETPIDGLDISTDEEKLHGEQRKQQSISDKKAKLKNVERKGIDLP